MERHLHNLHNINHKIKDPVEFNNFIDAAIHYIKKSNDHTALAISFIDSLNKDNNSLILRTIYEVAAELDLPNSFICISKLTRDFNNKKLRSSIIKYLQKYKVKDLDKRIKKLLYKNRLPMDVNVTNYLKTNFELTKEFMFSTKKENLFTQLDLMINSHIFYNVPYFIQFLGSDSHLECFKTYEAFCVLFELVETDEKFIVFNNFKIQNSILIKTNEQLTTKSSSLFIEEHSLNIVNLQNFIVFGSCFLKETTALLNMLLNSNEIVSLFSHYCSKIYYNEIKLSRSDLYERKRIINYTQTECNDTGSFDHLFQKNYYKDICDCYEF